MTAAAATSGNLMNGSDLTTVMLVNYGVKERLDSLQLKQMVRMMGGESDAGRALLDHARQMDTESQQAVDALAMGAGPGRSAASGTGTSGAGTSDTGAAGRGTSDAGQSDTAAAGRGASGTATSDTGTSGPGASGSGRSGAAGAIGGGTSGASGGPGGAVQMLAQQAREVLQAIRELDGNAGEGSGARRGASDSGRDSSGSGDQEGRSR